MSFKAQELAHEIADELKKRFSTGTALTVAESFDTNNNPNINVGAGSAGGRNAYVVVAPITWTLAKDVLGLSSNIYTPHVVQLCTEANPTTGSGADILTAQDLASLLLTLQSRGTRFEWYVTTNGTAPTFSGITAGNLKATTESSLYWNMLASQ